MGDDGLDGSLGVNGGNSGKGGGFNGSGRLAMSGGLDVVMRMGSDEEAKNGGGS